MLLTCLDLELRKLRGTLALLLCLVAPSLVAVVATLIGVKQGELAWPALLVNAFGLWAYFVLPLTVAALSALVAQIEHGPRAWDHLFALPVQRGNLIVAKAMALALLIAAMSVLLVALVYALGSAAGAPPWGFPSVEAAGAGAALWASSLLMAVIQLWVAIRFRSFVVPVALGLAGTFVVVAAMGAPEAVVLPWAMPLGMLPVPGGNPPLALAAGFGGALLLLPLMAAHLGRRDS